MINKKNEITAAEYVITKKVNTSDDVRYVRTVSIPAKKTTITIDPKLMEAWDAKIADSKTK